MRGKAELKEICQISSRSLMLMIQNNVYPHAFVALSGSFCEFNTEDQMSIAIYIANVSQSSGNHVWNE